MRPILDSYGDPLFSFSSGRRNLDKKDLGQLVATLRKESRNEFDEPMTQYDLAKTARIPLITLQKVEQGRLVNIKPGTLLNLAGALHLNSRATQTFFLASLGIKDIQTIKQIVSPQDILAILPRLFPICKPPRSSWMVLGTFSLLTSVAWPCLAWKPAICMPHICSPNTI